MTPVARSWNAFWFSPRPLLPLGVFRAGLAGGAFAFYTVRQLDFEFLFTDRGMVPYTRLATSVPDSFRPPVALQFLAAEPWGLFVHTLLTAYLLALALGAVNRAVMAAGFAIHLAFIHRNPLAVYGADQVLTFCLLYLCLTQCNERFTILRRRPGPPESGDALTSVGLRLLQIHVCVMYAHSGLDKMRGTTWWRGDALWNVFANAQFVPFDMSFVHHVPAVLALATLLTVLWEIYFPCLVWVRRCRPWLLAVGVVLHASIGVLLQIPYFSYFMICTYVLFLDPATVETWVTNLGAPRRKLAGG